eukprot:CAMPEP_0114994424 /NCGR_PEP_ID=MMETSP0216-20121206/13124_1 /TAXON_ID=223996 /ORGANISM="Protocruzia adherens, Strain Boccale" /LENGTH=161 /DNA_ID=CAMNT_0002358269 /DNA_START=801 /DNA_END=1286 /DNA_ORIENTATION=+
MSELDVDEQMESFDGRFCIKELRPEINTRLRGVPERRLLSEEESLSDIESDCNENEDEEANNSSQEENLGNCLKRSIYKSLINANSFVNQQHIQARDINNGNKENEALEEHSFLSCESGEFRCEAPGIKSDWNVFDHSPDRGILREVPINKIHRNFIHLKT